MQVDKENLVSAVHLVEHSLERDISSSTRSTLINLCHVDCIEHSDNSSTADCTSCQVSQNGAIPLTSFALDVNNESFAVLEIKSRRRCIARRTFNSGPDQSWILVKLSQAAPFPRDCAGTRLESPGWDWPHSSRRNCNIHFLGACVARTRGDSIIRGFTGNQFDLR